MITIQIGNEERELGKAEDSWIAEQIDKRRKNGESVCIVIDIATPTINITFATKDCQREGGVGNFTAQEQRVIDRWRELRLTESEFTMGQLSAFLNDLKIL